MRLVVCLRYQEAHHQGEPVEVCPNHLLKNQEQKIDHPRHVLQYCGERFATYSGPPDTGMFEWIGRQSLEYNDNHKTLIAVAGSLFLV